MAQAFEPTAFQNTAFQAGIPAFEPTAFQNTAFETGGTGGGGGGTNSPSLTRPLAGGYGGFIGGR